MRVGAIAFYGTLALGLHLVAFAALAPGLRGSQAAGAGGADRITLAPASAQLAALVQSWSQAPAVPEQTLPEATPRPPVPEAPTLPAATALPDQTGTPVLAAAPPKAPSPPRVETRPPPAPARPAPTKPKPAKPKPAKPKPAKPRAARPAMQAKGQGGGVRAGQGGRASVSAPGRAGAASAQAAWGAEIMARIEREKRYPDAAEGATGRVRLSLRVSAAGRLEGIRIVRGSGSAPLDRAALAAVRAAGPFPPAPKAAGAGPFDLALTMLFRR